MRRRNDAYRLLWLLCVFSLVFGSRNAGAASVLLHGAGASPSAGADAAIFARLESLFGPGNATYMQSDLAAADGSSANGFDALVISSTVQSASVRGKYEDSTVGIVNWESAIMDDGMGEFQLSNAGDSNTTGTQINIDDPSHPLAAGLSGTVTVFSSTQNMVLAVTPLAEGVKLVASATLNTDRPAIIAADEGDLLLGNGTDGFPMIAAGRRVNLFLHDVSFGALTPQGISLFDAAVEWAAKVIGPPPIPGDTNGNMIPGEFPEDFDPIRDHFRMNVTLREQGDLVRDGVVDFKDYREWKTAFLAAGGSLVDLDLSFSTAVPEPSTLLLLVPAGFAYLCRRALRRC